MSNKEKIQELENKINLQSAVINELIKQIENIAQNQNRGLKSLERVIDKLKAKNIF